ncbi:MAG: family 16 glycosylhydrolase [Fibrobacteria bacterium]
MPLLACAMACGTAAAGAAGWKLAWSEEFNAQAVDASVWGFENGYLRNNEAQYYSNRSENSRSDGGTLLIRALRDDWNGHAYTSASRTTRGRKSWQYGRFEIRAKIDVRAGSWPAWWWLPDAGGWPRGGEIDMMEFYQSKCLFNVMDGNQKWTSPTRSLSSLGGARWAEAFHVWTMEWDSTRIDLSLDGTLINHYPLAQADGTGPNGSNPFRHPGYMILNQAIGGDNGGNPAATEFPVDLRVDWVRIHAWTQGPSHTLTVTEGTGGGEYLEGTEASVTAHMPPAGQVFDKWVLVSGSVVLDDASAASARLTMPATDIGVKATYKAGSVAILPGRSRVRGVDRGMEWRDDRMRAGIIPKAWFGRSGNPALTVQGRRTESGPKASKASQWLLPID